MADTTIEIRNREVEKLPQSQAKLTVTVAQDSVQDEYDTLLRKYSKEAQIKGFRKGKVPKAVLERKFGDSIRFEALNEIIQKSLGQAFEEIDEKPLPYARPDMDDEDLELDPEKDLQFSVTYDIFPEISVGDYKSLEVEVPQVTIGKEEEEHELKTLQEQNALVVDKPGAAAEGDLVTVHFEEHDQEDQAVEGTRREDFTFTVGSKHNIYEIDDEVVGMSAGESKTVEKSFPDDYRFSDLAGSSKRVFVEVTAVKRRDIPELDDELAQDISDKYETLDDLRKDIRDRLRKTADSRVREEKVKQVQEHLMSVSEVDVPRSMLDMELDNAWRNFVQRMRAPEDAVLQMLAIQGKNKEMLLEEWKEEAEKNLKLKLVVQKLIEDEKLEASDEEVDEEIKKQAESASMSFEETKEYFEQQGMTDYIRTDLKERKLYDKLLDGAKTRKGKKIKLMDVLQGNQ